ncbi:hypothetical protein MSG81_11880 [Acinetobacter baumannii]|nr:hypothetical protein [Acinetobacter baumannii]
MCLVYQVKTSCFFSTHQIDEKYFLKKGFCRNDLMPIAATLIDKDIFLIGKRNSSIAGKVIWYAGEEIEIFEKFNEFF